MQNLSNVIYAGSSRCYSPIQAFFFLSSGSAEMKPRIEIFMLKLDCGENFVMFGHSGHKLQRFEDLVFTIHLYGI